MNGRRDDFGAYCALVPHLRTKISIVKMRGVPPAPEIIQKVGAPCRPNSIFFKSECFV